MKAKILGGGLLCLLLVLTACGPKVAGETGTEIVSAKEAMELLESSEAVLVDTQSGLIYRESHIVGAVNISRSDIVVNDPQPNLLCPPDQLEEVLSSRGIGNETLVIAYDANKNMDSARLWWTLKVYGHDNVKVVSGGLDALVAAGASLTDAVPSVGMATFRAGTLKTDMIATRNEIKAQVDDPDENTVLIDTRTEEEYNEGTIPGSILLNFVGNNFSDQTFRPVRQIQIRYLEVGIGYDCTAIMYCKTSIRGAQTYLAMYNAGFRDLKLYDGAWVEWSANPMNPVFIPDTSLQLLERSDNS